MCVCVCERETERERERERERETYLVIWCFKPSQPKTILSGLREIFINRYLVERTNEAEIRSEEQSEKAESCLENLWNGIQLKEP